MVFTTVNVKLHTDDWGFTDYVDGNKFYNIGVQALAALKAHKTIDVHLPAEDDYPAEETIIPYHAVLSWSVTKEEGSDINPEDEFCKSDGGGSDDGKLIAFGDLDFAGEGQASAKPLFNTFMEPDSIRVVIDGTSYSLTKNEDSVAGEAAYYGVENSNDSPYVEILVGKIPGSGEMTIYLPTAMAAGTYSVEVYDTSL